MINHEFWMVQLGFAQKMLGSSGLWRLWMVRITGPERNFHSTSVRETGDFGAFLDLLFAFLVCCVGKIREFH